MRDVGSVNNTWSILENIWPINTTQKTKNSKNYNECTAAVIIDKQGGGSGTSKEKEAATATTTNNNKQIINGDKK